MLKNYYFFIIFEARSWNLVLDADSAWAEQLTDSNPVAR